MNNSNSPAGVNRAISLLEEVAGILRNANPDTTRTTGPGSSTSVAADNPTGRSVQDGIVSLARFRQALPLGTAFASSSNSTVQQEVRNAFQPYPVGRGANVASRRASGARRSTGRDWARQFFCLGGPADDRSPTNSRKLVLQTNGLGSKIVRMIIPATGPELRNQLLVVYPRLDNIAFQLLKSEGGGSGGKILIPIGTPEEIPAPEDINLYVASGIVYIRPLVNLLEEDTVSDNGDSSANQTEGESGAGRDGGAIELVGGESVALNNNVEAPRNDPPNCGNNNGEETDDSRSNDDINSLPDSVMLEEPILTMVDFRRQLYEDNVGIQPVCVQRDNFAESVIGVYKSPNFDLKKKPQIIFAGEAGTDVGALQKEFFWRGISALLSGRLSGRLPFFEGEDDHKLPTCDSILLRAGIFKSIGMFMAHGAMHSGLAFVGLSQCVVEYLLAETVDIDTHFNMTLEDIPDIVARGTLLKIHGWCHGIHPSQEDLAEIQNLASECDFNAQVGGSKIELEILNQHIMHHLIIWRRRAQLEALKTGFSQANLRNFLQGKDYVTAALFPSTNVLLFDSETIVGKIECGESSELVQDLKSFISAQCKESAKLGELVAAWTGWAMFPDEPLVVKVVEGGQFCFHSCFQELELPAHFNKEDLLSHLRRVLQYGTSGFGSL